MRSNFQSLMSSRNHPCVHRPLFLFVKLLPMLLDNTDRIILYPTAPIKKKKKPAKLYKTQTECNN